MILEYLILRSNYWGEQYGFIELSFFNSCSSRSDEQSDKAIVEEWLKKQRILCGVLGWDEGASADCLNPLENKLHNPKRFDDEYCNSNNMQMQGCNRPIIKDKLGKMQGVSLG